MLTAMLALSVAAPPTVYEIPAAEFERQVRYDLGALRRYADGMARVYVQAGLDLQLFKRRGRGAYAPDERRRLKTLWATLYAYFSASEQLRQRYWGFVNLPPTDPRHPWGFVATHLALTAQLDYGLAFAGLGKGNKQLETLLDEADAELGLPARSFAGFKAICIHVGTHAQLLSGNAWLPLAEGALAKSGAMQGAELEAAWKTLTARAESAVKRVGKKGGDLLVDNALDILRDSGAAAVFPVQKSFAEWLGDTRVARQGTPLISAAQRQALVARLSPGDIVVTRQNWFLSNLGLPGFWPHAELYLGLPADLAAAFDADVETRAWVGTQPEAVETFTALLAKRFPDKWQRYQRGVDFQGHGPIRVIEAISEGVSFTALEHAFGVDYLGVMRPRLPPVEKAQAILRAFHYQGRPYDFDFDFYSDATLVCTELVFKAYQPGDGMKGLQLTLVDVAGRMTLPAVELVKRFAAEADRPDRQLDFVAFLDGREAEGKAVEADLAAFRGSPARPKWDIAQP